MRIITFFPPMGRPIKSLKRYPFLTKWRFAHFGHTEFKVTENNTPSNPVTAKKINGSYTSIDILGNKNTQQVTGSLAKGQLSITKYAPSHYSSYMGTMVYYLDGAKGGSVTKYY